MDSTSRSRALAWPAVLALATQAGLAPALAQAPPAAPATSWRFHGGDPGHTQYSPLAQINTANVSRLKTAWIYRTGDARPDNRSQIQCNPIVVGGVLYASSPQIKAFDLDAASGRALWTFD